jgi:hypothetical protein
MSRFRSWGLAATLLAVVVLTGSLIVGLRDGTPTVAAPGPDPRLDGNRVRVEVLNGAGIAGLAREATRELRDRNFDVVYFGNAGGAHRDSSVVLDRVGRPEEAETVARVLGIHTVASQPDSTLYLEATVILGRDWVPGGRRSADGPVTAP